MAKVTFISGSPTEQSKSTLLLQHIAHKLQAQNIDITHYSLRDFPAEDLVYGKYDSPAFDSIKKDLAESRAVILGTPIYKASLTGGLKALLDILPQNALRDKTVVPVVTGGSLAHLLAIEFSIKPILSVLGSTDLRQGVFVVDQQFRYTESGFELDDSVTERLETSLSRLLKTLQAA